MGVSIVSIVIWVLVIALIVGILFASIFIVRQQTATIIERFGKFNRAVGPGIHLKIPIIEKTVANVSLRTQELLSQLSSKTKDNVTIDVHVAVQFFVSQEQNNTPQESGVYKSYYRLSNPTSQMTSYVADALRSSIPNYTLDEVFENKDLIAKNVNDNVSALMSEYGFDIISTLITNIVLPTDVERSMNSINAAQRDQEAAKAQAEADRIRTVVKAQAEAEAMKQTGIGIAEQRKAIAEGIAGSLETIKASGVSTEEANKLFLYTQWTEMMDEFAEKGNASTVVLSSDFAQTATMFDQLLVADKADKNR